MTSEHKTNRILSIDAFRGITILVMVFVNELAGVRDIPAWMKHLPADADAMSFVDLVFPAFLFIVGLSIPFALTNRQAKGDSFWRLQAHILWRTLGLLLLGVFMVNAEQGIHAGATGMRADTWSFLFYFSAILVWNQYRFSKKALAWVFRIAGMAGLLLLALCYRSGSTGTDRMGTHWWGILGLIGWAYLYACLVYQVCGGRIIGLLLAAGLCTGIYILNSTASLPDLFFFRWLGTQSANLAHTSIVLYGIVVARIFFANRQKQFNRIALQAIGLAALLFVVGALLRPSFKLSKIYASPSWCLFSAAICTLLYLVFYVLIDRKGIRHWTDFFRPAAENPLLTYILPGIVYALTGMLGISLFPDRWYYGLPGIGWALVFAVLILILTRGLNALKIKLQL